MSHSGAIRPHNAGVLRKRTQMVSIAAGFCRTCDTMRTIVLKNAAYLMNLSPERTQWLYQRAMNASSCGITIADVRLPDMPLVYVNDAFYAITGYAPSDVIGRNCRFLQQEDRDQQARQEIRQAVTQGSSCKVRLRNYRRDGTLFWNELFLSPVKADDGELTHFIGVQTDVTLNVEATYSLVEQRSALERTVRELRETQMMLVHAEKMNALGQMVAGIAHEINNPLSYINSNLHGLKDTLQGLFQAYQSLEEIILNTEDPLAITQSMRVRGKAEIDFVVSDVDDILNATLDGLGRVKNIVTALRTFARLDEAKYKLASIRECVDGALLIASAALRDGIQVIITSEDLPPIYCFPAELNQVFLNLIVNAAQSIQGSGTISIRISDDGDSVAVSVQDTGMGIPDAIQSSIFTPFFTTKPVGEGVGLGLAIAYKIITDRHHGSITFTSAAGEGTTFLVRIPKGLGP